MWGNYYYDLNKCGIGYHGDAERKRGVCVLVNLVIYIIGGIINQRLNKKISIPLEHGECILWF